MDRTTHQIRCEQWARIINECLASNKSKTAWCRENNISVKKFFYWQRILRNEAFIEQRLAPAVAPVQEPPVAFVELKPSISESAYQSDFRPDMVIRHNGTTIEISNNASKELLKLVGGLIHAE